MEASQSGRNEESTPSGAGFTDTARAVRRVGILHPANWFLPAQIDRCDLLSLVPEFLADLELPGLRQHWCSPVGEGSSTNQLARVGRFYEGGITSCGLVAWLPLVEKRLTLEAPWFGVGW
jgi:hypothetical protein